MQDPGWLRIGRHGDGDFTIGCGTGEQVSGFGRFHGVLVGAANIR